MTEGPLRLRNIRLINEEIKDQAILGPIVGYTQQHLPSLHEACKPLVDVVQNILHYASVAIETTPEHPPDDLTHDESAAIRLYTMEWDDRMPSLYSVLNRTLRTEHRDHLRPWFKYLALFLTALVKLPCAPLQVVWRGVAQDISAQFPRGTDVTWWSFSSCTTTLTVLENALYLGNASDRTLFSIEAFNARNISAHSYFKTEDEILLLPGTYMEVRSQLHPTTGLHIVHLRQKIPDEMLLEPPFPDAPVYPAEESSKMAFYHQKRWYIPISSLVVAIIIGVVLGSVLGTRSFPSEEICNITTLSTLTKKYEIVYGLWYTTASGNSVISVIGSEFGKYNITSAPWNALDQNFETDFMNVGSCLNRTTSKSCGIDTGFFVIPVQGATLLSAIQFTANGDAAASDPLTITIEGSNEAFTALMFGKSWSLLYSGATGLKRDPGRSMRGAVQCINNTVWYSSYRILVTSKRDVSDSVSYGEVTLIGHENPNSGLNICNATTWALLTSSNELTYGVWNTVVMGDSTPAIPDKDGGSFPSDEAPRCALDQRNSTKYTNMGECSEGRYNRVCGINTGFYVTPQQGATMLQAIQFTTTDENLIRDPLTITIEGSNANWSALTLGASWSLIATLRSGLDIDPGRTADGLLQCLQNNTIWYRSYRILVTSVRRIADCVQYSEIKLFGYGNPNKDICSTTQLALLNGKYEKVYGLTHTTVSGDGTLATSGEGVGNYFPDDVPRFALDQNNNTKYTNFGDCFIYGTYQDCGIDTGFFVTLQQGATLLLAIQFTTADDTPTRDPLSITIEGSNATASALMLGASWSFIYSVSTGLEINRGRRTDGSFICLPVNIVWYRSYRIIVTSMRDVTDRAEYSEVKLFGYDNPNKEVNTCNIAELTFLTTRKDAVYGLTNTTVLGNGTLATPGIGFGNYFPDGRPQYALDQKSRTKYTSFGHCFHGGVDRDCGSKTGFYVTPQEGATLLVAIQFTTANDSPARDPLSITIEGSNATSSALMLGASWSFISNASTGLELDPGRENDGPFVCLTKNVVWYTSYRILISATRSITDSVQYSEVKLIGYTNADRDMHSCNAATLTLLTTSDGVVYGLMNTTLSGDGILATPGWGAGNYVPNQIPLYALDGKISTKYASFGACIDIIKDEDCSTNTGFYVTLQQGATLLLAIQFTTANDDPHRDPLSITIEGSNATSSALMRGTSWSLITSTSTGLEIDPGRRNEGTFVCLPKSVLWYTSYRILVTSIRDNDTVQYSEVKLFGYGNQNRGVCNTTVMTRLTGLNEAVYGVWNTTFLGNSTLATQGAGSGRYIPGEEPRHALDKKNNTKYTSVGDCSGAVSNEACGINTGFYVTPRQGSTLLLGIQFTTANNFPVRDPLSITIEGSNATSSALLLGTSWSLIGSVFTGLEMDPGRETDGMFRCLSNNVIWYTSYRILITSLRGVATSVQYSEVKLFGYENPNRGACSTTTMTRLTGLNEAVYGVWNTTFLGNSTLATQGVGSGRYKAGEEPRHAFDQNTTTKYLNFGNYSETVYYEAFGIDTGFYVTPRQGSTLLLGIQFTTANDFSSRDPLSITIEGSNATSYALLLGTSWSLIDSVSTGLEVDPGRETDGMFRCLSNNVIWYTSYRILITSLRGVAICVQYSEVKLFGYENPNKDICSTTKLLLLTGTDEIVHGLWNTTFLGNSTLAMAGLDNGRYKPGEEPQHAFDQNTTTKYLSFGDCLSGVSDKVCGIDTGFYVTPRQGPTFLLGIQFTTGNDVPDRDPMTITIEGSNATSTALLLGTSWSLIDSVSTGLEVNPGRTSDGMFRCLPNNVIWYTSYRILITSLRGVAYCVQYSEVKLFGYGNLN